jgi:hypothetical protein
MLNSLCEQIRWKPKRNNSAETFLFSLIGMITLPTVNLSAAESTRIDLSQEQVGAEPSVFAAAVGSGSIGTVENNKKVLVVDVM